VSSHFSRSLSLYARRVIADEGTPRMQATFRRLDRQLSVPRVGSEGRSEVAS